MQNVASASEAATVSADSVRRGTSAASVIDGEGLWMPQPHKSHPHWIWIRFKAPARIASCAIEWGNAKARPTDFALEYSPDGGRSFREIAYVQDASGTGTSCEFKPVVADNLRLRIVRSSDKDLIYWTQIKSIRVLGEYAPVAPRKATAAPLAPRLQPTRDRPAVAQTDDSVEFRSKWLRVTLSRSSPAITAMSWDSLGKCVVDENFLKAVPDGGARPVAPSIFPEAGPAGPIVFEVDGNVVRYRMRLGTGAEALWEIRVEPRAVRTSFSVASPGSAPMPLGLQMAFDLDHRCTAPIVNPKPGERAPLPLLLHAADAGTLLVRCSAGRPAHLEEDQRRDEHRWDAFLLASPAGSNRWEYSFEVVPTVVATMGKRDARLDKLPLHWLDGFQYHPWTGMLGNNMFNESTSICLYSFAEPAIFTPVQPGGVKPIEMVRESVTGYLRGAPGYATVPDLFVDRWTDAKPSVLISAWTVIRVTGDLDQLRQWMPALERLAGQIEAADRDGDGLPESPFSGLPEEGTPSNWWDTIRYGHNDAYGCALAYRGLQRLADLEGLAGRAPQAKRFGDDAERIRNAFVPTFMNPKTGVLAGWRDSNGGLHDYWFQWLNGMAIVFGLVPDKIAGEILDRFQAKFKEVGYDRFDLGLPGNLIPVRREDYTHCGLDCGEGTKPDGSDGFPRYENGGASACFAYYYIQALYQTGRYARRSGSCGR